MSITVTGLSFGYPDNEKLLESISFHIPTGQKGSLIGNNGTGKSSILKILSGELRPTEGEVSINGQTYFVPQHYGQYDKMTVAAALGLDCKLKALKSILGGSVDETDYELVGEDWDIEDRIGRALANWDLDHMDPLTPFEALSGGEKTKVFLAGTAILNPLIILMDEPTNHLDRKNRERLRDFISGSSATMLIVSHDRELLNLLDPTLELTSQGIVRYGGNYDFYKEQHTEYQVALSERIGEAEKAVRAAELTARKAIERKNRSDARGKKKQIKGGIPRIAMKTIKDGAEKSGANLSKNLDEKKDRLRSELLELRTKLTDTALIKIKVQDPRLHTGKVLIDATDINFGYDSGRDLWPYPLDIQVRSGERIAVKGSNGAGKTTLLKVLSGQLEPGAGRIKRNGFSYVYMDQEYRFIDDSLTVIAQFEKNNERKLPDHQLKTALHHFLFPRESWDRSCGTLSGGEKMRLMLCCLLTGREAPELFILDEPTNNLDIGSMEILTSALKEFAGTLLVISHDEKFLEEIGVDKVIDLDRL